MKTCLPIVIFPKRRPRPQRTQHRRVKQDPFVLFIRIPSSNAPRPDINRHSEDLASFPMPRLRALRGRFCRRPGEGGFYCRLSTSNVSRGTSHVRWGCFDPCFCCCYYRCCCCCRRSPSRPLSRYRREGFVEEYSTMSCAVIFTPFPSRVAFHDDGAKKLGLHKKSESFCRPMDAASVCSCCVGLCIFL